MKKLLLCCFLILTSPVFAAERTDYRDWDKTRQQVVNRYDQSFKDGKKQAAFMEKYASGKLDTMISQIDGQHKVRTMIRDSGYDPDTGKKIRIEANVTQTANKAKVASTLVDRLGKAKDYAKHVGKASIPSFVGTAAFHGLMEGIGWVMDEGGKVTKHPTNFDDTLRATDRKVGCIYSDSQQAPNCIYFFKAYEFSDQTCKAAFGSNAKKFDAVQCSTLQNLHLSYQTVIDNPFYSSTNPVFNPPSTPVSDEQLTEALKNALESNNPALAAAIAQAIKDAYTPEGKIATIGDEQANGLAVNAADTARDAVNKAANNTGSEPSSKGKPGYYNITDGDKTIEGNVYETDPTGSITPKPDTGTGTEPGTDTGTGTEPGTGTGTGTGTSTGGATLQLPAFCEWAGIVCDFIEWYKTEPEDDAPELPEHELEKKEIDKELLNVSGSSCPQDLTVNWTGLPFGITINESFEMQPYCNELEPLKYVFILITTCLCAFMFVRL